MNRSIPSSPCLNDSPLKLSPELEDSPFSISDQQVSGILQKITANVLHDEAFSALSNMNKLDFSSKVPPFLQPRKTILRAAENDNDLTIELAKDLHSMVLKTCRENRRKSATVEVNYVDNDVIVLPTDMTSLEELLEDASYCANWDEEISDVTSMCTLDSLLVYRARRERKFMANE